MGSCGFSPPSTWSTLPCPSLALSEVTSATLPCHYTEVRVFPWTPLGLSQHSWSGHNGLTLLSLSCLRFTDSPCCFAGVRILDLTLCGLRVLAVGCFPSPINILEFYSGKRLSYLEAGLAFKILGESRAQPGLVMPTLLRQGPPRALPTVSRIMKLSVWLLRAHPHLPCESTAGPATSALLSGERLWMLCSASLLSSPLPTPSCCLGHAGLSASLSLGSFQALLDAPNWAMDGQPPKAALRACPHLVPISPASLSCVGILKTSILCILTSLVLSM